MKVKLFKKKFTLPGNLSFFLKYYLNINTYHIKKKKITQYVEIVIQIKKNFI